MQILNDLSELNFLTAIDDVYAKHEKVFNACFHEQGRSSGYVRLRNYLRTTGKWAKGEVDFDHIWTHKQIEEEEIASLQKLFPGMSDVQAGLIRMMDNARACHSLIESIGAEPVTNDEIDAFTKELFEFIQPIEKYLLEEVVTGLHVRFDNPLLLDKGKKENNYTPTLFKLCKTQEGHQPEIIQPEDYEQYRISY